MSRADHDRMANAIRALSMDAVEQAKSGHPGRSIFVDRLVEITRQKLPEVARGEAGVGFA